jgi:hypothetical protein
MQLEEEDKIRQLQWEEKQNKLIEKENELKARVRNNVWHSHYLSVAQTNL